MLMMIMTGERKSSEGITKGRFVGKETRTQKTIPSGYPSRDETIRSSQFRENKN
jgi:hypothetical protein